MICSVQYILRIAVDNGNLSIMLGRHSSLYTVKWNQPEDSGRCHCLVLPWESLEVVHMGSCLESSFEIIVGGVCQSNCEYILQVFNIQGHVLLYTATFLSGVLAIFRWRYHSFCNFCHDNLYNSATTSVQVSVVWGHLYKTSFKSFPAVQNCLGDKWLDNS